MKRIYKYPVLVEDYYEIPMPRGAKLLAVQIQHGSAQLWAIVDPNEPSVPRRFCLRGTGHPMNGDEGAYVGTFQASGGALVFHLFDRGEE